MRNFNVWFDAVSKLVRKSGFDVRDLPDQPYFDWFDDGLSPSRAAKRVLKAMFGDE